MVVYRCLFCGREVDEKYIKKRIHCPYCDNKILYKPQVVATRWKAR